MAETMMDPTEFGTLICNICGARSPATAHPETHEEVEHDAR